MSAARFLPAALAFGPLIWAEGSGTREAPSYSAASIVNAASNVAGSLAPYMVATIYGAGLAHSTRALRPEDIRANALPRMLDGVRVFVNNTQAELYFVSPSQINFVVPHEAGPNPNDTTPVPWPMDVTVWTEVDGVMGPKATVKLREAAPGLFQQDAGTVIATHADWSLITTARPARPGEDIVLFATGLGRTAPPVRQQQLPQGAASIEKQQQFQVWLAGQPLDAGRVAYVGITPGYAGLYQINLRLPEKLESDPEVRISVAGETSPAGLRLPCTPGN
ncbi:MAG: hypothetical protein AAB225_12335 [Acidobacteriota bacterium]